MFFGPGGGTGLELVFSDDVRNEIELVEDQEVQLRALADKMRQEMRSAFSDLQELPEEERREAMMARMDEQRQKAQKEMESILLDHQLARLKQLQLQSRLQRGGAADALASDDLRQALGLTDEQLEKMRQVAAEADAELRETVRKATEQARNKVLEVLSAEQRAKWEEMTGSSFSFENSGPFGRGGRGGRGGGGGRFGDGGRFGGGQPDAAGPPPGR
jgi:hypothetical protein